MLTPKLFQPTEDQIRKLVDEHPLASVVSVANGELTSTPIPLLFKSDGDGDYLFGHFARANPQVRWLREDNRALIIAGGPHNYVSPSWFRDRTQAPTWNFARSHFSVQIEFLDDKQSAHQAVLEITKHMERGRDQAWSIEELGERYERMLGAIIAFKARIYATRSKFKLGQNERADIFSDIIKNVDSVYATEIRELMTEMACLQSDKGG